MQSKDVSKFCVFSLTIEPQECLQIPRWSLKWTLWASDADHRQKFRLFTFSSDFIHVFINSFVAFLFVLVKEQNQWTVYDEKQFLNTVYSCAHFVFVGEEKVTDVGTLGGGKRVSTNPRKWMWKSHFVHIRVNLCERVSIESSLYICFCTRLDAAGLF